MSPSAVIVPLLGLVNVALNAPVSGYFSGSTGALTAEPSLPQPGWVTSAFSSVPNHTLFPDFVVLDLGAAFNLSYALLFPEIDASNASVGFPSDFTISVAEAGEPWVVVASIDGWPSPPPGGEPVQVPLATGSRGRFVRLLVTQANTTVCGPVVAGGAFVIAPPNPMVYWVPEPNPAIAKHQLDPGACEPCAGVDACGNLTDVPQAFLDGLHEGANFSCVMLPTVCTGGGFVAQVRRLQIWGPGGALSPIRAPWPPALPVCTATATGLRTAYSIDPVGVDSPQPTLNWTLASCERGDLPIAWHVVVGLADGNWSLWDSGWRTDAALDLGTSYDGAPLRGATQYVWRVALRDAKGAETPLSAAATFVTAKLPSEVWVGQWIGTGGASAHRGLYFRSEFDLPSGTVVRAVAMFCGLGFGELFIDGSATSDWRLSPGFTQYNVRTQYVAVDMTSALAGGGRHCLGAVLGDGWYALSKDPWVHNFQNNVYVSTPKLRIDMVVTYEDGSSVTIASNASAWRWSYGPITRSWIGAEDIDAREALPPGWGEIGFNASSWVSAAGEIGPDEQFPGAVLVVQREAPTRVQGTIAPQTLSVTSLPAAQAYVYDFGREFQGWVRLTASGPVGANVTLLFCGSRDACDANTQPNEMGGPDQSVFTLSGSGNETWEPRFMYASVHQLIVRASLGVAPLGLGSVVGVNVAMDAPPASAFACSDDTYAWLHDALARTQANYITGFPNDPTREKKGWTQDIQTMLGSAALIHVSARRMYPRWVQDILDNQAPSGLLPEVAPGPVMNDGYNGVWWGGMGVFGPAAMYQLWGDPADLLPHYSAMRAFVEYLNVTSGPSHFVTWGLGDWLSTSATCMHNSTLINTPGFYLMARLVGQAAAMLGDAADAAAYAALASDIASQYIAAFVNTSTGVVATGEQCFQALALGLEGFLPDSVRPAAESVLLARLASDNNTLTTGFVTFGYMLSILSDLAPDVGHAVLVQRSGPGPWSNTAGSSNDLCKEEWDGSDAEMPSLVGPLAMWSQASVVGLRGDPLGPGFRGLVLRANVGVGGMLWASLAFDGPRGRIAAAWSLSPTPGNGTASGDVRITFTVPPGSSGTVFIPTLDASSVTEGGQPASKAVGVTFVRQAGDRAVFAVTSGSFAFEARFEHQ